MNMNGPTTNQHEEPTLVLTDTTTLWSVDAVTHKDYQDWRGEECLVDLADVLIDPRVELRCFFQTQALIGEVAQKVPEAYQHLMRYGLLVPERRATAKEYEFHLNHQTMLKVLTLSERWCMFNPGYANAFKALHRHRDVYDLERYRAMSEDGRTDAVPPVTHEFCMGPGKSQVARIAQSVSWTPEDVEFIYAIILRGLQYECAAHMEYRGRATYLRHPTRWLGGATAFEPDVIPAPGARALRLGGRIVRAWKDRDGRQVEPLVEWLASVRSRAAGHYDLLDGKITKEEQLEEAILDLLRPIPPLTPDEVHSALSSGLSGLLGLGLGALTGELAAAAAGGVLGVIVTKFLNAKWTQLLLPKRIPDPLTKIPMARSLDDYPDLGKTRRGCPRCRTETNRIRCPVCGYRRQADHD